MNSMNIEFTDVGPTTSPIVSPDVQVSFSLLVAPSSDAAPTVPVNVTVVDFSPIAALV
jgi:hypothetical protein